MRWTRPAASCPLASSCFHPPSSIVLSVDASGAAFPITLDPAITGLSPTPDWTAEGDQASAYFGISAGTAGDVNGDGYADVIVGADSYDNGQANEGRAYVYYGGSDVVDHYAHINKSKIHAAPAARPAYYKVVYSASIWNETKQTVPGALVMGTWTYPDGSTHYKNAVTDDMGHVKFPIKEAQTGTYTFCITDIRKARYGYDPDANTSPACLSKSVP